jgi:hypothetical protein
MGDLQLGLLAIGAGVVAAIFFYNKWQERDHRRRANAGLSVSREDVLMRQGGARARPGVDPLDRVEPALGSVDPGPARAGRGESENSAPLLSEFVDFLVPLEPAEKISGSEVVEAASGAFALASRPVRWEGFDPGGQCWEALDPERRYSMLCAGLQLVDRRGAASAEEVTAFADAVLAVAGALGARATVPEVALALQKAGDLDRFCSDVDILVAVHVAGDAGVISAERLRKAAESAGLEPDAEKGGFRRRDTAGRVLFTLTGSDAAGTANAQRAAAGWLTLELDVPRGGSGDFDAFRRTAEQLARSLGGRIVDDNRQPLGAAAFDAIREQVRRVHAQMEARGIQPAGALALRLFS